MKKKRQKSAKKSRKNQKKKQNVNKNKEISEKSLTNQSISSNNQIIFLLQNGKFQCQNIHKKSNFTLQNQKNRLNNIYTFFNQPNLVNLTQSLITNSVFIFIQRGLDDKKKYLHNIYENVLNLFIALNVQNNLKNNQIECSKVENFNFTKLPALITIKSLSLTNLSNSMVYFFNKREWTQSCVSNICLDIQINEDIYNVKDKKDEKIIPKKSRPSYIIERDCHIFGGCVDDDGEDEFFISSGAVYQSWPYVYEPGYRMEPLPQLKPHILSISDEQIDYFADLEQNNEYFNQNPNELPSYSLDNFGINLFHINEEKPYKKKHRRRQRNSNIQGYDSNSIPSSFYESDLSTDESSDDDSDSYRAYKQRHAIGLNNFNTYNSQSSLSDLGNGHFLHKNTNLCHTDSSSCDEYMRKSMSERLKNGNQNYNQRLTTSYNICTETKRGAGFFGKVKFMSQNQYQSSNNLIF